MYMNRSGSYPDRNINNVLTQNKMNIREENVHVRSYCAECWALDREYVVGRKGLVRLGLIAHSVLAWEREAPKDLPRQSEDRAQPAKDNENISFTSIQNRASISNKLYDNCFCDISKSIREEKIQKHNT